MNDLEKKKDNDTGSDFDKKLKFDKTILKDKMKALTTSLNKKIAKHKFFQIKANNRLRVKK
jgi:hypothetical protein